MNLAGFKTFTQMGVFAKLGEAINLPVQLQIATVSETVEVRVDAADSAEYLRFRANVAVLQRDELAFGVTGTAELLVSRNINDIRT